MRDFARRAALAGLLSIFCVLFLVLLFLAFELLLVVFAGVLLAVLLRALSDPLAARTSMSPSWALLLVILALAGLVTLGGFLIAPGAAQQLEALAEKVPEAIEELRGFLERWPAGRQLIAALELIEPRETLGHAVDLAAVGGGLLVYLLTFFFVGLFVAVRPKLYSSGLVRLFPRSYRKATREALALLGRTLRWFLIGRLLSMTMVGVSTALVLVLVGVPLAGLLGLIAGLLTFAPYLGPILGGIPILVVALIESPMLALWAIVAYTVVQWIEGYIIDPLIQHRMVELPPAITVTSQVLLGMLAGGIGIAIATPLAAVVMVLIQVVWVRGILDDPVHAGPRGFNRRKKRPRQPDDQSKQ